PRQGRTMTQPVNNPTHIVFVGGRAGAYDTQIYTPSGVVGRVSVDGDHYRVMRIDGDRWFEASVRQSGPGAVEFRTARPESDGSVVARMELAGRVNRNSEIVLDPRGKWRSQTEHSHRGNVVARTRSEGDLNRLTDDVRLERIRFSPTGEELWRAEA